MSSNARTGSTPVAGSRDFGGKSLFYGVFRYYYVNQKAVQSCTALFIAVSGIYLYQICKNHILVLNYKIWYTPGWKNTKGKGTG